MILRMVVCAGLMLFATGVNAETEVKQVSSQEIDTLIIEDNIIKRTNAERARYGLPALKIDATLMKNSRNHGIWMASRRSLTHSGQSCGENIAMGYASSSAAMRGWMNSPGHRANILTRGYTKIGVSAYRTANGTIYWCQQFRR